MSSTEKIPVLAVVGPTASGKTALGVMLAKLYNGEVVSADSMQIYKGMSIATAKPTLEEQEGVTHHLIDFLDLETAFSVADYVELAGKTIREIHARGKLPVLVGGTGLYVSSLLDNIQFSEHETNHVLREKLTAFAEENGKVALHERLRALDSDAADEIHPNNLIRVVRALEVCIETGEKFSVQKEKARQNDTPYETCIIGLDYEDRSLLYDRINLRVDMMMKAGLLEEARSIWQSGNMKTAANAIGYKELVPYFEGRASLPECIEEIKLQSRHYAKRQLTWFRRNSQIKWIKIDKLNNKEKIKENCQKIIAKTKIL